MKTHQKLSITQIFGLEEQTQMKLPIFETTTLSSSADEDTDKKIDIHSLLVKNPASTFIVKVAGNARLDGPTHHGDMLLVDRAQSPQENSLVIISLENEFMVRRIIKNKDNFYLAIDDDDKTPIQLKEDMGITLWGVITHIIHKTSV